MQSLVSSNFVSSHNLVTAKVRTPTQYFSIGYPVMTSEGKRTGGFGLSQNFPGNERREGTYQTAKTKQYKITSKNSYRVPLARSASRPTTASLRLASILLTAFSNPTPAQFFPWDNGPPSRNICTSSRRYFGCNAIACRGGIATPP
jgi:hypothetical protein